MKSVLDKDNQHDCDDLTKDRQSDTKRTLTPIRVGLVLYLLAALALFIFTSNEKMVVKVPYAQNYGVLLLISLFVVFFTLLFAIVHKSKPRLQMAITPLVFFFFLFAGYFFLQFFLLGGYSQRIFGFFSILFPPLAYLLFINIPRKLVKRFLGAFIIGTVLVLSLQTISTVAFVNTLNQDNIITTQTDIDRFFGSYCDTKPKGATCVTKETQEEQDISDEIHEVKDYSFKDLYQVPIGGSNYIAAILVFTAAAAAFFPFSRRWVAPILVVISGVTIYLANSFGGLLSFLVLLFFILIFKFPAIDATISQRTGHPLMPFFTKHKRILTRITAIVVTVLVIVGISVVGHSIYVLSHDGRPLLDVLLTGRVSIYQDTLSYFTHSPIIGFGFQFDAFMAKPHNLFLALLAYGGLLGLFFFLLLIGVAVYVSLKFKSRYGYIFVLMIIGAFTNGMLEPNLMNAVADYVFWTMAAATLAMAYTHRTTILTVDMLKDRLKTNYPITLIGLAVIMLIIIPNLIAFPQYQYVTISNVELKKTLLTDEELSNIDVPKKQESRDRIVRRIEAHIAYDLLSDRQYMKHLNNRYNLDVDPKHPNDVLYFSRDDDSEAIALRIITSTPDEKARLSLANHITNDFISQAESRYPEWDLGVAGTATTEEIGIKVYVLAVVLGLLTICSWILLTVVPPSFTRIKNEA